MERPSVGGTSGVLAAGTLLSVGCFVVGFLLALLGGAGQAQDPRRLDLLLQALVQLEPWAWSMLGVLALLATPPAGLIATALETRRLQPATALFALAVLGVLALATLFALLR